MYLYVVKVKANLPYPVEKEYRIECWKLWTAISRGIKLFRADKKVQRKKLSSVSVSGYRVEGRLSRSQDSLDLAKALVTEIDDFDEEGVLPPKVKKAIEDKIAKTSVVIKKGGL